MNEKCSVCGKTKSQVRIFENGCAVDFCSEHAESFDAKMRFCVRPLSSSPRQGNREEQMKPPYNAPEGYRWEVVTKEGRGPVGWKLVQDK